MVRDGKRVVEKTIRPNGSLPISLDELNEELAEYRERLVAAGIRMPRVTDSWVEDDCVVCLCEDGGENLVELYETPRSSFTNTPPPSPPQWTSCGGPRPRGCPSTRT